MWGAILGAAGGILGGILGGKSQERAAESAAASQAVASDKAIAEQRRQFDELQELLKPYVSAGLPALTAQQNLLGLGGNQAQQTAIDAIKNSSQFAELNAQGQNAILQNASATGGLRGGNTQAALAQFSPQLLQSLIDKQFTNLGGLTSLGQNAAAMQGNAGMQTARTVSDQLNQIGAANAGLALASGQVNANMFAGLGKFAGTLGGLYEGGLFKGF